MSCLIAVTGKGGVGKTTISALLVSRLVAAGKNPVLAIDADPNSCLDSALGVTVANTVGKAREDVRKEVQDGLAGISKQERLQLKISESLVEAEGFDLIAMGRPEGAGCYCYANGVLKNVIGELAKQYPFVVLDNEAGLENLSRRIVQKVDILVLVSDASNAGMETLKRLYSLTGEMGIEFSKLAVIVNRIRNNTLPKKIEEVREHTKADYVIGIPDDPEVAEYAENNRPISEIPAENPVVMKIDEIVRITK